MSTIHPAGEESASGPDGKDTSTPRAVCHVNEQHISFHVHDRALEVSEHNYVTFCRVQYSTVQ